MTTRIYIGLPHDINIVVGSVFKPEIRKFVGGTVIKTIAKDKMLNATLSTVELPDIEGIPVFSKSIDSCDPLPDGYDIYVVSQLYASAAQKCGLYMNRIYTVADPVYTEDGATFIGCRGICRAF